LMRNGMKNHRSRTTEKKERERVTDEPKILIKAKGSYLMLSILNKMMDIPEFREMMAESIREAKLKCQQQKAAGNASKES